LHAVVTHLLSAARFSSKSDSYALTKGVYISSLVKSGSGSLAATLATLINKQAITHCLRGVVKKRFDWV
jgi:hypothetical protein